MLAKTNAGEVCAEISTTGVGVYWFPVVEKPFPSWPEASEPQLTAR
jgi:hypothetical protein